MPGLDPGIHERRVCADKSLFALSWIAGSSPAMTTFGWNDGNE
jgi:hypothetical protein